jgi:Reverse transcriptase (RNA-dependent DNA polymerase)
MTYYSTTLCFQGRESQLVRLKAGIPQGSPLLPILFLFYNIKLLEICTNTEPGVTVSGFIDDVNILAYSQSTAGNCRKIKKVYNKCLE